MLYDPEENFKDDANPRLKRLHEYFYRFSPIALIFVFAYLGLSILGNQSNTLVFGLRVFLISFFTIEFVLEFLLYENKKKLLLQNLWKVLLLVPILGFLRILGHLAQLFNILSVVKMAEQGVKSLDCYIFDDEQ